MSTFCGSHSVEALIVYGFLISGSSFPFYVS